MFCICYDGKSHFKIWIIRNGLSQFFYIFEHRLKTMNLKVVHLHFRLAEIEIGIFLKYSGPKK